MATLIFVVEDDHVITYAGTEFAKARNVILGGNRIVVWRDGIWLGDVNFDGKWLLSTDRGDRPDVTQARVDNENSDTLT